MRWAFRRESSSRLFGAKHVTGVRTGWRHGSILGRGQTDGVKEIVEDPSQFGSSRNYDFLRSDTFPYKDKR